MKRRLGAALLVGALLLTGCASVPGGTVTDGTSDGPIRVDSFSGANFKSGWIPTEHGKEVFCITSQYGSSSGGISCNWATERSTSGFSDEETE